MKGFWYDNYVNQFNEKYKGQIYDQTINEKMIQQENQWLDLWQIDEQKISYWQ